MVSNSTSTLEYYRFLRQGPCVLRESFTEKRGLSHPPFLSFANIPMLRLEGLDWGVLVVKWRALPLRRVGARTVRGGFGAAARGHGRPSRRSEWSPRSSTSDPAGRRGATDREYLRPQPRRPVAGYSSLPAAHTPHPSAQADEGLWTCGVRDAHRLTTKLIHLQSGRNWCVQTDCDLLGLNL